MICRMLFNHWYGYLYMTFSKREVFYMSVSISQKDAYAMIFKEYPDVVSVTQMSKMLGISEKSAYRLLKKNCIEHFKVGRTYKIPKLHIFNYLHVIGRS